MSTLPTWWALALSWQVMMALMMAPTAYPWLRAAGVLVPAAPVGASAEFAAGYFAAWLPFSLLLAAAQWNLAPALARPGARAGILFVAGLYQFAPLKRACLKHCRQPLSFLLARWNSRPQRMIELGLRHGWICLGCCWALMATMLAAGMANWLWMIAVAVFTFAEQVLPRANWLRPALGLALIAAAAAVLR